MRIKVAIASGMIVGAGLLAAPGTAIAALSDCNTNNMCMWGNNDFVFMIGERTHCSGSITNLSGDADNQMDSWANRSAACTGCMWGARNGTGDPQTMAKVSSDNNVSAVNSDEVTSWRTLNGC